LDRPYNALDHLLARFPPYAAAVRWTWTQVLEWGRRGFDEGTVARRGMLRTAHHHLEHQVPDPTLRQALVPTSPLGCKRIVYSIDCSPSRGQPHVTRVTAGIRRVTPHGIRRVDGEELPVDVLGCATGVDTVRLLSPVGDTGLGVPTLRDAWTQGP